MGSDATLNTEDVLGELQTADLDPHSSARAEAPGHRQTAPNYQRAENAIQQTGMARTGAIANRRL